MSKNNFSNKPKNFPFSKNFNMGKKVFRRFSARNHKRDKSMHEMKGNSKFNRQAFERSSQIDY